MKSVFIDGREGTTGLQIEERLAGRSDLQLLQIDPAHRKDPVARRELLNAADFVFLCLPDAAAREAVEMIENPSVRVIDASTAHRTAPGWDYGFAELSPAHRAAIAQSHRVANPGCHASGFISIVYPLVQRGLVSSQTPLCAYSLTGYSGGGKKMIAEYEAPDRDHCHDSSRVYGLNQHHKHLPEMQAVCGLAVPPVFSPVVGDFYCGMATTVLFQTAMLPGHPTAAQIHAALSEVYDGARFVTVAPLGEEIGAIYANTLADTNELRLFVCGHDEQLTVTALFDNLGKGASGAAVQNLNIMMGVPEDTGL
jgi:N-acetyl-gamma-glutamyl-phosphate reductase